MAASSLGEIKLKLNAMFKDALISSFSVDADLIISKITGYTRAHIIAYPEKELSKSMVRKIAALAAKRAKRYPMAYILGEKEFYGLNFKVTPHVLIPRPETEHLIDAFIEYAGNTKTLLDLCSGSGCIGITLKKHLPSLEVHLADIDKKALKVSRKNANAILGKNAGTLKFIKSDLFSNIKHKYDAIISNPPYVSHAEYNTLSQDVYYEPQKALLAKEDGYFFYRQIAEQSSFYLNKKALLFLEIGDKQKQKVVDIFNDAGFCFKECIKDLALKDRSLVFSKK